MKISFELEGLEEERRAQRLLHAEEAFSLLWELDNFCRNKIKYGMNEGNGQNIKTPEDALQAIRDEIHETSLLELWE